MFLSRRPTEAVWCPRKGMLLGPPSPPLALPPPSPRVKFDESNTRWRGLINFRRPGERKTWHLHCNISRTEKKEKKKKRRKEKAKGADNNNERGIEGESKRCEKVQHDDHERIIALFSFLRPAIVCLRVKVQDVDYEIESASLDSCVVRCQGRHVRDRAISLASSNEDRYIR